jgi:hypothetical protein
MDNQKPVTVPVWSSISWVGLVLSAFAAVILIVAVFGGVNSIARKSLPLMHEAMGSAGAGAWLMLAVIGMAISIIALAKGKKWLDVLFMQALVSPLLAGVGIALLAVATGYDGGAIGIGATRFVWNEIGVSSKWLGGLGLFLFVLSTLITGDWLTRSCRWLINSIPAPERSEPVFNIPESVIINEPVIEEKQLCKSVLTDALSTYGTSGASVVSIKRGAVIERHYVELPIGADTAKIEGKLIDIARAMKSTVITMERNAGNGLAAFDLPRKDRQKIMLDSVLESREWAQASADMILPVVIGEFIDGEKFILDLPKAIHAIIAGTSGCGKSSLVNAILLSLMQSRTPDQVKLLLIDPKVVEFTDYANSTYLYHPVVTDMDKALDALNELVLEMEIRYQMMAAAGVKNIIGYQRLNGSKDKAVRTRLESLDASKFGSDVANHGLDMPYIVCVVDEFADLMAVSSDDVETAVARLGQKARAAGIIDLLLTQRPSVDVITGLIKANCPTRFGLTTVSGIDSKTIIDTVGLEKLLSMGDMLYISPSDGKPKRAHSAYVPDEMIQKFMK